MTVDEQIREVYAYFGLAVYFGQLLEQGIVNAMVTLRLPNRDQFTKSDIDVFMDQQFENTLGKLFKNLRAETALPPDVEDLLAQSLRMRNWLCHDYFRERAVEFMTELGRQNMLAELADARDLLERAEKRLAAVVQPIANRHGVTDLTVQATYEAICSKNGILA